MGCVWFVQIITRAKTPEDDVAAGAGSMEREGYPNQAGSAPSMQPDVSAELSGIPWAFLQCTFLSKNVQL